MQVYQAKETKAKASSTYIYIYTHKHTHGVKIFVEKLTMVSPHILILVETITINWLNFYIALIACNE